MNNNQMQLLNILCGGVLKFRKHIYLQLDYWAGIRIYLGETDYPWILIKERS